MNGNEALKELYETMPLVFEESRTKMRCLETIAKELKDKEEYEYFVQEICNYLGLDNLFPYKDLKEIEKQIKTIADSSHWIAVKQDQKKLKALEIFKVEFSISFNDNKQEITLESIEQPYTHIRFSLTKKIEDKSRYDLLKEVLL